MDTDNLQEVVRTFADLPRSRKWADPIKARCECGDAARAFIRHLKKFGIVGTHEAFLGRPDYVVEAREEYLPLEGDDDCHILVKVGEAYFDWTARQYRPFDPFPLVVTRQQMEAWGWRIREEWLKTRPNGAII